MNVATFEHVVQATVDDDFFDEFAGLHTPTVTTPQGGRNYFCNGCNSSAPYAHEGEILDIGR